MEPVLQFDPANMSVWYSGFPTRADGVGVDVLGELAERALLGRLGLALQMTQAIPDGALRVRAGHVVSAVAHEQRHFADLLLTNYGQSLARQVSSLMVNVPNLLVDAQRTGALGIPVTVYADSVRRLLAGVGAHPELDRIAVDVRDRELMAGEDEDVHAVPGGGAISVGGRAQLEALAYFTQAVLLQVEFDAETALAVQEEMPDPGRFRDQYLWAAMLGAAIGLQPSDPAPRRREVRVLAPAVGALLYGTLMIRRWGQEQTAVEGGHSGSAAARLDPLLAELRKGGELHAAESSAEAWQAVDDACERAFGRSARSELEHDLDHEASFVDLVQAERAADDPIAAYLRGCHAARRRLAERFAGDPSLLTDPTRYTELLTTVSPVPIFAHPAGADLERRQGWRSLWRHAAELGAFGNLEWCWASAPVDAIAAGERIHVVADSDAWTAVVESVIPLAKLLVRGRRQPVFLGPELQHAEQLLLDRQLELRFDPAFAEPLIDTGSEGFWFLSRRTSAICDGCGAGIDRGAGHDVPSIAFRRSDAGVRWLVEHGGGGELGLYQARRDWTGWLLCDACAVEVAGLDPDPGGVRS
jgi:hypothetical protein